MIPYNTQLLPLKLPEYGRNIHQMIDYCVHIPDREERTRCAYTIAHIMESLFPELVTGADGSKKVWDHINIIAGFQLDIDFPCEVATREEMHVKPQKIEYGARLNRYRHYGRYIQEMISRVADMEPDAVRDSLISMIAHQMKKLMLQHNKEGVDDARILRDLAEMSDGKIALDPSRYILHEYQDVTPEPKKKKKK